MKGEAAAEQFPSHLPGTPVSPLCASSTPYHLHHACRPTPPPQPIPTNNAPQDTPGSRRLITTGAASSLSSAFFFLASVLPSVSCRPVRKIGYPFFHSFSLPCPEKLSFISPLSGFLFLSLLVKLKVHLNFSVISFVIFYHMLFL